jgi:hypothetical protein
LYVAGLSVAISAVRVVYGDGTPRQMIFGGALRGCSDLFLSRDAQG